MTKNEFTKICGFEPSAEDLSMTNCRSAGKPGHLVCGLCPHRHPKCAYTCKVCFPDTPEREEDK